MLNDAEKEGNTPPYLHVSSAKTIGRPRKCTTNISTKNENRDTRRD